MPTWGKSNRDLQVSLDTFFDRESVRLTIGQDQSLNSHQYSFQTAQDRQTTCATTTTVTTTTTPPTTTTTTAGPPPDQFVMITGGDSACLTSRHRCQMAIARFLDRMCLALRASRLWLRYATLQNLIPSFPWIAPPRPPPWRNPRKGRDQILPSCR